MLPAPLENPLEPIFFALFLKLDSYYQFIDFLVFPLPHQMTRTYAKLNHLNVKELSLSDSTFIIFHAQENFRFLKDFLKIRRLINFGFLKHIMEV